MPDTPIQDGPVALGAQPVVPEMNEQEAADKQEEKHFQAALDAIKAAVAALDKAKAELAELHGFTFVPGVRSTIGFCQGTLTSLEIIHLRENEKLARRLGRVVR